MENRAIFVNPATGTKGANHLFIMASSSLFRSIAGAFLPKTNTRNGAGAPAYMLSSKHALAQYAATGCFNSTFYASAQTQLDTVLALTDKVDATFVAKAAVFARERGAMKDMPALLSAVLSVKEAKLCGMTFSRVMDDAKMIRNFVQIIRSGKVGRKSLGTRPKRLVTAWLDSRTDEQLFRASVGQNPSLADVIKMVHPKPLTASRRALYGYLLGRPYDAAHLPKIVTEYEDFKALRSHVVPDVPFQMLTALTPSTSQWVAIARNASWTMTRMNLNTFARHGVFEVEGMAELIADRIRNPELVRAARAFPYQLLAAYRAGDDGVPPIVKEALQDAMEIAIESVPAIAGKVYVLVDVSGSMSSPITGYRPGATTTMRCIDGAALVAAAILRKNPYAEVIPFEQKVVTKLALNPRDTVMTNAQKLASIGGGGTNCSAPLAALNAKGAKGDVVVYVSDNESWVDARRGPSAVMTEWEAFKRRNRHARMICIDFTPNSTTQAHERADILNIGGFSDVTFELLSTFANGEMGADHWIGEIEKIKI